MNRTVAIAIGSWNILNCIFLMLSIRTFLHKKQKDIVGNALCALMGTNVMLQVFDIMAWYYAGMPGRLAYYLIRAGNFCVYVSMLATALAFLNYLEKLVLRRGGKLNGFCRKCCYVIGAISIMLLCVNLINGFAYDFDEYNLCHRTSGYFVIVYMQIAMVFALGANIFVYGQEVLKPLFTRFLIVLLCVLFAGCFQAVCYRIPMLSPAISLGIIVLYACHLQEKAEYQEVVEQKLWLQEQRLREQERELSVKTYKLNAANEELHHSRISLLMGQIKPHFIYNTITMIRGYCYEDPEEAADLLGKFSKFLRGSVDFFATTDCIRLQDELDFIRHYLHLQQKRFGDRLQFIEIVEAQECYLPAFSIYTLVENAVIHGIENCEEGGMVQLRVIKEQGETVIIVKDNGNGFDTKQPVDERFHTGISNVRERVEKMCKGTIRFESEIGVGTTVWLYIPDRV